MIEIFYQLIDMMMDDVVPSLGVLLGQIVDQLDLVTATLEELVVRSDDIEWVPHARQDLVDLIVERVESKWEMSLHCEHRVVNHEFANETLQLKRERNSSGEL